MEIMLGDEYKLTLYEACEELPSLTRSETHMLSTIDFDGEYLYYLQTDSQISHIVKQHLENGTTEIVYSNDKEDTLGFLLLQESEFVVYNRLRENPGAVFPEDSYILTVYVAPTLDRWIEETEDYWEQVGW